MKRIATVALMIAAAAAAASAQTPGDTRAISGCVQRAQRDGSLGLTAAGTTATPNTAATEANSGEMVDAYRLTNALPGVDGQTAGERTEYALQGNGAELAKHVGHQVEIRGRLLPSVADAQAEKTRPAEGINRFQVTEVKMLGAKCTPKG